MTISANFPATRPSLLLDFSNQTVLDPRVTFTRTTTAYYYDNHSAALAEQNLLLRSNEFTNAAWTVTGLGTPVLNATDPSGTANGAYTLTASLSTTTHTLANLSSSLPISTFTASVYLQVGAGAGSYNFATLYFGTGSTTASATFNLSTGVLTQSGATGFTIVGTPSITQVGSTAWYRCILTATSSVAAPCYVTVQMNNAATFTYVNGLQAAWLAAGTETLLVYGAQ